MTPFLLRGALAATLLPCVAAAQADLKETPPTHPGRFVEVPGEMEFNGVLTALPLQAGDAAIYGLTADELALRRAEAQAALAQYPLVKYIDATDETLIEVGVGNEQAVAQALMAEGGFRYVEPDWTVYPIANCTSDPLLGNQWHHNANRMNSCNGWDIEVGDPNIVVAICDTGVRTNHNDLQLHRKEGYNAVDQQWENSGGAINDINGHGTATTGCAAANGDNGTGISGTGQSLGHRMMRVSNSSGGSSSLSVLNHAARTASDVGDRVANISYSGVTSSSNQTTGAYCRAQGTLVVWAAGNSGNNYSGNRDDELIVVIATNSGDNKPSWSNYGSFCDLAAPGESVYTTSSGGNNSYGGASGTSFSAPLTAGLIGLIFSADPSLSAQEAEDILRAGCDDIGSSGVDNTFGYGRIDVGKTLELVDTCGFTNYCDALPNSSGFPGIIYPSGSASISANDLTLYADLLPPGKFGIFFVGTAQASTPLGQGILCVGGTIGRYGAVMTDSFGSANQAINVNALPGGLTVQPGDVLNFSYWTRDVSSTFNFTNGLSVQWCN